MLVFARFISIMQLLRRRPDTARIAVAVAVVFFANSAGFASALSRLPAVRQALQLSHGQVGGALLAMAAGVLLALPLAGRGCSALGARSLALAASFAFCFVLPHPGVVGLLPSLVLSLFVQGAVGGTMGAAAVALGLQQPSRPGRTGCLREYGAAWAVGGLAGAALGGLLGASGVPPALHLGGVALALALAVWAVRGRLPRARPPEPSGAA
jgi:MFS family permease